LVELSVESTDSPEFIFLVETLAKGLLRFHAPEALFVVKIRNWFGPKWLHFSGKGIGLVPVWKEKLTIPPFVPNRVISQRKFDGPTYAEADPGTPLHLDIPARRALLRSAADVAPRAALMWYCSNSKDTGRGAVMAYVPKAESYEVWYAGWQGPDWRLMVAREISVEALSKLHELGA
jgi:hypothetical protein